MGNAVVLKTRSSTNQFLSELCECCFSTRIFILKCCFSLPFSERSVRKNEGFEFYQSKVFKFHNEILNCGVVVCIEQNVQMEFLFFLLFFFFWN